MNQAIENEKKMQADIYPAVGKIKVKFVSIYNLDSSLENSYVYIKLIHEDIIIESDKALINNGYALLR